MSLCKGANLTLIVKVLELKGLIELKNNRIIGQYGEFMDMLLETKSGERDCKLIGVYEFGHKFPNESHTSALGMLEQNKADLYLAPSTQFFIKDFLDQSSPISTDRYIVGHTIEQDRIEELDILTMITEFESNIKIFLVLFSLIFVIALIAVSYLSTSKLRIKRLISNLFQFECCFRHPISNIGLMLFFYQFFYFLFKLVISNLIATSKCVVDTSHIMNTMDKLLHSESIICWLKNDIEITTAAESPKNSNLFKLFNEKKYSTPVKDMEDEYSDHCLLSKKSILGQEFDLKGKILLLNQHSLYGFLTSMVAPTPSTSYWIADNPIFETLSVYYFRKNLTSQQKHAINRTCELAIQSGLANKVFDLVLHRTQDMLAQIAKYYTGLNSFVTERMVIFHSLQFSFIRRFLILFFILNSLFTFIFLIKILVFRRRYKK